jgi:hypothetical protein
MMNGVCGYSTAASIAPAQLALVVFRAVGGFPLPGRLRCDSVPAPDANAAPAGTAWATEVEAWRASGARSDPGARAPNRMRLALAARVRGNARPARARAAIGPVRQAPGRRKGRAAVPAVAAPVRDRERVRARNARPDSCGGHARPTTFRMSLPRTLAPSEDTRASISREFTVCARPRPPVSIGSRDVSALRPCRSDARLDVRLVDRRNFVWIVRTTVREDARAHRGRFGLSAMAALRHSRACGSLAHRRNSWQHAARFAALSR